MDRRMWLHGGPRFAGGHGRFGGFGPDGWPPFGPHAPGAWAERGPETERPGGGSAEGPWGGDRELNAAAGLLMGEMRHLEHTVMTGVRSMGPETDPELLRRLTAALEACRKEITPFVAGASAPGAPKSDAS